MNKLIKEILINKAVRKDSAMIIFAATAINAGIPWITTP